MYHLNPETGRPNKCQATKKACPYGAADAHFATKEQARQHYEAGQKSEEIPDAFTRAMQKQPGWVEMERQIIYTQEKKAELAQRYERAKTPVQQHFYSLPQSELEKYNRAYAELEPRLTEAEKTAMYDYTGITFDPINKMLTNREKFIKTHRFPERIASIVERMDATVAALDSYLAKATPVPRRVFRRIDQDHTRAFTGSEEWATALNFKPGATVVFPAYASTSLDPGYIARTVRDDEHTSIVFVIDTKQGAPVSYTHVEGPVRATQDREREILLPRDIQFRVTKVERAEFSDAEDSCTPLTVFLEEW